MSYKNEKITLKVLFFVAEDLYFYTHRLSLAIALKKSGYEVVLVTRTQQHREKIEQAGIKVVSLRFMQRSSLNPLRELCALIELFFIYGRERPSLVHHVALKPVLYGSLISFFKRTPVTINALGGLGFVFSSQRLRARLLRKVLIDVFKFVLNRLSSKLIVQNADDKRLLIDEIGVRKDKIQLIRSAGVELDKYPVMDIPSGTPVVALASRMLWDKGIGEFVDAARILKNQNVIARFVLIGDTDLGSPTSISKNQLMDWHESGVIEWWGYSDDIPSVLSQSSIVCLPTYYGEGVPKILLEAMACGRPIITTDMPGCRDLVIFETNGLIIPPRDCASLAYAIKQLLLDRSICRSMGLVGRDIVEKNYTIEQVIQETLSVYHEFLPR